MSDVLHTFVPHVKPKPIEIKRVYHSTKHVTHVDIEAIVPILGPIGGDTLWIYTRAVLRCVPVDGDTINWDKWSPHLNDRGDLYFPMWQSLGVLPTTLSGGG